MTAEDLVRALDGRGRHPRWRACCPVHEAGRRYGRALSIYAAPDKLKIYCHAGCKKDDILAAVGLKWQDLAPHKEWMNPEAYREYRRQQEAEEKRLYRLKVTVHVWTNRTRFWERVAALLLGHLIAKGGCSRLWHAALAASRTCRERLWEAERRLTPSVERLKLPEAQCYALEGTPGPLEGLWM